LKKGDRAEKIERRVDGGNKRKFVVGVKRREKKKLRREKLFLGT